MDIFSYLFPIFAALTALKLWNTEYKAVSLVFAGDFVILFAVAQIWLYSSLPAGIQYLPEIGWIYIFLFCAYLLTSSNIGYIQAGLSAFIGVIHFANPNLQLLTEGNYQPAMTFYCLIQFITLFGGISYELHHRHIPINSLFRFRSHHNGHKGA
jgi:hypothetical protein